MLRASPGGPGGVAFPKQSAVLWSVAATAGLRLRADEPPRPPSGDVRVASSRIVEYSIHFDRNALRDSLRLGDGLIALTSSGTLLRFEPPEVRLVRERIGTEFERLESGRTAASSPATS